MHVPELCRMGADIRRDGAIARRAGRATPTGRAGHGHRPARLGVPGARRARRRGNTVVDRVYHLDRGYETLEKKLRARCGHPARRGSMPTLTIALPKGRLLDPALSAALGLGHPGARLRTRGLLLTTRPRPALHLSRATDVPTYVEYGAPTWGSSARTRSWSSSPDLYEPLDLKFGYCRMMVAEPAELSRVTTRPAGPISVSPPNTPISLRSTFGPGGFRSR